MTKKGERVQIESRREWRDGLAENLARDEGIWLVTFKKHTGEKYVSYDEVVEEALCFGWVDSRPRRLDEDRPMLWISPRTAGSGWSRRNKERVEKMVQAGLMAPAGWEKIEAAKPDGSWTTLEAVEALEIPFDLARALDSYDSARGNFEAFPRSVKRNILEWIANAKRPLTRTKRVEETAHLAQDNIRANPWRQ